MRYLRWFPIFIIATAVHFGLQLCAFWGSAALIMGSFENGPFWVMLLGMVVLFIDNILQWPVAHYYHLPVAPYAGWIPIILNSVFWGGLITVLLFWRKKRRENQASAAAVIDSLG